MLQELGVVIVVLLILIATMVYNTRSVENTLLSGFWTGGAEFCKTSQLDVCVFYIEPGSSNRKPGYILMKNSDGFILNNPVIFHISGGRSIKPYLCDDMLYRVTIEWIDDEPPEFFPSEQDIYYYPKISKMVWLADDEITAVLYKNGEMCDVRTVVPEAAAQVDNSDADPI